MKNAVVFEGNNQWTLCSWYSLSCFYTECKSGLWCRFHVFIATPGERRRNRNPRAFTFAIYLFVLKYVKSDKTGGMWGSCWCLRLFGLLLNCDTCSGLHKWQWFCDKTTGWKGRNRTQSWSFNRKNDKQTENVKKERKKKSFRTVSRLPVFTQKSCFKESTRSRTIHHYWMKHRGERNKLTRLRHKRAAVESVLEVTVVCWEGRGVLFTLLTHLLWGRGVQTFLSKWLFKGLKLIGHN